MGSLHHVLAPVSYEDRMGGSKSGEVVAQRGSESDFVAIRRTLIRSSLFATLVVLTRS